jgi:hypothetical protein
MQTRQLLPRLLSGIALAAILWCATPARNANLWYLKPVQRPKVPVGLTQSGNPSDVFIAAKRKEKVLRRAVHAGKATLLRRVYFDPTGIAPSPAEREAFVAETNPNAHEKVVDRLLMGEQHGARYAGHWLDVLTTLTSTTPWRRRQESTTPNA